MSRRRGRGRPRLYTSNVRRHIAGLIRKHGALRTANILNASVTASPNDYVGSDEARQEAANEENRQANLRNLKLVPNPLEIAVPTVCGIAKEFGIALSRGRRRLVA